MVQHPSSVSTPKIKNLQSRSNPRGSLAAEANGLEDGEPALQELSPYTGLPYMISRPSGGQRQNEPIYRRAGTAQFIENPFRPASKACEHCRFISTTRPHLRRGNVGFEDRFMQEFYGLSKPHSGPSFADCTARHGPSYWEKNASTFLLKSSACSIKVACPDCGTTHSAACGMARKICTVCSTAIIS